jgi:NEDD8-activating enzyme E1
MGVTKNIIPAVASTNALISAACVNECLKVLTGCNKRMNDYMMCLGQTRCTVTTFPYARKDDCLVCSNSSKTFEVKKDTVLADFVATLKEELQIEKPTIEGSKGFLVGTGAFAKGAEHKLKMTIGQLLEADDGIVEGEEF